MDHDVLEREPSLESGMNLRTALVIGLVVVVTIVALVGMFIWLPDAFGSSAAGSCGGG